MSRFTPIVALLLGCGASAPTLPELPPLDPVRSTTVAVAVARWEHHYGIAPDCALAYAGLRWRELAGEEFDRACAAGMFDSRDACIVMYEGVALITVRKAPWSQRQLAAIRIHEISHWMEACSGRNPDGDPHHRDREVWDDFVDQTVEALRY
jgi:hypothetical protein